MRVLGHKISIATRGKFFGSGLLHDLLSFVDLVVESTRHLDPPCWCKGGNL